MILHEAIGYLASLLLLHAALLLVNVPRLAEAVPRRSKQGTT